MELTAPQQKIARFGIFEVDLKQRVLTKSGLRVRVQGQPFQVLALLLERPGELITRDEIQRRLWPADTYVAFDDGLNTAVRKLRTALSDDAENPRFIETVPRRGYRFVAPVTFPVEPLVQPSIPADSGTQNVLIAARERSRIVIEPALSRSPWLWVAVVVAVVLAAAVGYFSRTGFRPTRNDPSEGISKANPLPKPRRSVAVMGFRNLSRGPEEAWLSTALAEMLNTELAAGERLRMVPGEQISRAKRDLSLADTEALSKDSLTQVRTDIGADYVVLGSYTALGPAGRVRIRLDLRLQDARAGETVAEEAITGNEEDLFNLVSEAGARLRQKFDLETLASEEAVRVRASIPSNAEAARLYAEGLNKLRTFDALNARDLLLKAVTADSKNALIHAALASAWSRLGYDSKAQLEAKQAFDLSGPLSREEHLVVEGRYRTAVHEWKNAVGIYRTLWNLFPDNLDYGLQLASAQTSAGYGKDALATVAALRKLPEQGRLDPRIDLTQANAAGSLGDFPHSQEAAASAAKEADEQHTGLLVADALKEEGEDWERMGQFEKSQSALLRSETLYAAAGDRRGAALTKMLIGELLSDHGDLTGARRVYNEILAACREIGDQKCAAYSLNDLGNLERDQNNLTAAKACYQQVLNLHRKTENRAGIGVALSNLASVADDLGDLVSAETMRRQAIDLFTELGDRPGVGSQQTNLAAVLLERGELSPALSLVDQSISLHRDLRVQRALSFALTSRADILEQEDRLAEARQAEQEALEIRKTLGTPEFLAMTFTQAASLSLDQDLPAEAVDEAQRAAKQIENLKAFDLEATAYALMARALLTEGKLPAAQDAAAHALASSRQVGAHPPRFDADLAAARVAAASGKAAEAKKELVAMMTEASRYGYAGYQLEARLALSEIDLNSPRAEAARAKLTTLENEARAKGFNLIARKAATALKCCPPKS